MATPSVPYVLAARTEATTVLEVDLDRVTAAVRAVAPGEPVTVDGVRLVPVADLGEEAYQVYLRDRRADAGRSAEAGPDAPSCGRVPTILPW